MIGSMGVFLARLFSTRGQRIRHYEKQIEDFLASDRCREMNERTWEQRFLGADEDKKSHDVLICPHCKQDVVVDMVWPDDMPAPSEIRVSKPKE